MKPSYIIIHHSLTPDEETVSWGAIRKYHLSQGWSDIGYHYGIELVYDHFEILMGRMPDQIGAHCKESGMNSQSLGICVVGNYDLFPPPQMALSLLITLTKALISTYGIPKQNVRRHSDFAPYKTCPGLKFPWSDFITRL